MSITGGYGSHRIEGVVARDQYADLVLLSVPSIVANPLPIGNVHEVVIGDPVYAAGSPLGLLTGTFSAGLISGIRNIDAVDLIQITAPISPGSSGGPILNERGEVIGIATAYIEGGQSLNFAVSTAHLSALLADIGPVEPINAGLSFGRSAPTIPSFDTRPPPVSAAPRRPSDGNGAFGQPSNQNDNATFQLAPGIMATNISVPRFCGPVNQVSFSLVNNTTITLRSPTVSLLLFDANGVPLDAIEERLFFDDVEPGRASRVQFPAYRISEAVCRLSGLSSNAPRFRLEISN